MHEDDDIVAAAGRRARRRRIAAGLAAVVLAGSAWWAYDRSAQPVAPGDGATVNVLESDLRDPERLNAILEDAGIPARIQIMHAKLVNGVLLGGCSGADQDGLRQIEAVLGPPPVIRPIGTGEGLRIDIAALPRDTQMSFVYWVMPGKIGPTTVPTMSLHHGTPPTCTLPAAPGR
ncbi:hypothetical protein GCM10010109_87230 [Actinoplanes campanulatus]|nr:hypothetical protein [Actinoplanes campanulatus]GGN49313.1 hypothetical protein GCM10010109_87230 [Actinoplanes campanulatus]GID41878.1 hypothetical protein Aca09nite_83840 [Actinoplanes campanulatus]